MNALLAAASQAVGLNWFAALLIVAVGVAGLVVLIGEGLRSLTGWVYLAISVSLLIAFCSPWAHTIHA